MLNVFAPLLSQRDNEFKFYILTLIIIIIMGIYEMIFLVRNKSCTVI